MLINVTASMCFFIVLLILLIDFSFKDKLDNLDNNSFRHLCITCLFGLLLEFVDYLLVITSVDMYSTFMLFLGRVIFLYYVIYMYYFVIYVYTTCKKIQEKNESFIKFKKILTIIYIVFAIVAMVLPFNFMESVDYLYPVGPATTFSYAIGAAAIFYILVLCIMNIKNLKQQKGMPILWGIIGAIVSMAVQTNFHQLLLLIPAHAISIVIMYHTIENPDIKMLNEMSKNKELMEQGYEDKYNFLFEMTQEARGPLLNINNLSNVLRMEDNPQKIKDGLLTLNNMVRQLDFSINNVLNISSLDVSRVKIVDNKYDLEKVCHDLEVRIKPEIKPTVKFSLSMPKQIPILYGDYMKIRQILYSLLVNACKNTENGSINMRVNLIEKYDIARLIFNISDTGVGMPIDKINEILSSTGSLDQKEIENLEKKEFNVKMCQKVVKIMGGNLMIKSNIGEGTEVILTVDQRVFHEKDNSILNQYENSIANYRKVLIVSQNKNKLGIIKKRLTDNHITYSNLYYGADAIDRIKSGKKFDFILVDDEMKEMSGFMTFKGMKEVPGFKTPVIIMLGEDKDHIKDHYLDDGFSDYILLDNLESELDRIIEKY